MATKTTKKSTKTKSAATRTAKKPAAKKTAGRAACKKTCKIDETSRMHCNICAVLCMCCAVTAAITAAIFIGAKMSNDALAHALEEDRNSDSSLDGSFFEAEEE